MDPENRFSVWGSGTERLLTIVSRTVTLPQAVSGNTAKARTTSQKEATR